MEKNLNFPGETGRRKSVKNEVLKAIEKKLKNARLIPNYLLILFGTLGIIALGLLGYFGSTVQKTEKEKFEIYRMIIEPENNDYQEYFSEHPEIKDDYRRWLEGKK